MIILMSCTLHSCDQPSEEDIPLPFFTSADLTPHWIGEDSSVIDGIHHIGPFSFMDQNGQTVDTQSVEGKIYVANFFFTTCPGVCRLMTGELMAVQEEFGDEQDVKILSHTVMPWIDTVQQLKHFEGLMGIDGSFWKLLTGEKEELYRVAREEYFADEGFGKSVTASSDFLHTENIMLIDKNRRIRGVYNGTSAVDVKRMIEDIYQLRKEG